MLTKKKCYKLQIIRLTSMFHLKLILLSSILVMTETILSQTLFISLSKFR